MYIQKKATAAGGWPKPQGLKKAASSLPRHGMYYTHVRRLMTVFLSTPAFYRELPYVNSQCRARTWHWCYQPQQPDAFSIQQVPSESFGQHLGGQHGLQHFSGQQLGGQQ